MSIISFPGGERMADDKTAADERALLDEALKMLAGGQDGVEAGFKTTEFYLTLLAVAIDVLGPTFGILQGIDQHEQLLIAAILAMWWGALRSWRKRGGPQKAVAELLRALAQARGEAPTTPPAPASPAAQAAEVPQAA
jgi:hypothetical protein